MISIFWAESRSYWLHYSSKRIAKLQFYWSFKTVQVFFRRLEITAQSVRRVWHHSNIWNNIQSRKLLQTTHSFRSSFETRRLHVIKSTIFCFKAFFFYIANFISQQSQICSCQNSLFWSWWQPKTVWEINQWSENLENSELLLFWRRSLVR